jgi:hypothetical protein
VVVASFGPAAQHLSLLSRRTAGLPCLLLYDAVLVSKYLPRSDPSHPSCMVGNEFHLHSLNSRVPILVLLTAQGQLSSHKALQNANPPVTAARIPHEHGLYCICIASPRTLLPLLATLQIPYTTSSITHLLYFHATCECRTIHLIDACTTHPQLHSVEHSAYWLLHDQ